MAALFVIALLFLGGVVLSENTKMRNTTKEPLNELIQFLKKSKFFKLEDMDAMLEMAREIKEESSTTPSPENDILNENDINSILNSKPKAWCPSGNNTTCSLHVRDVNFPSHCIGDFSKEQCLQRIGKYIADETDKKKQLNEYCQRINDVCLEYKNPDFASKTDCTQCGTAIPNCNC